MGRNSVRFIRNKVWFLTCNLKILKIYSFLCFLSETRLVEILDSLCGSSDHDVGKNNGN